jgi:hypothetical protein
MEAERGKIPADLFGAGVPRLGGAEFAEWGASCQKIYPSCSLFFQVVST